MSMNVLIDTSGWIEYFANGHKAKEFAKFVTAANKQTHVTPAIVLYEIYKKIKKDACEAKANEAVAFVISSTRIVGMDERIAIHAGDVSIETGLSMADAIIKATAELNNAVLITSDRHFNGLENVEII